MPPEQQIFQTFGKKAYLLYLYKWLETPVAFLVFAFIFSLTGRSGFVPLELRRYVAMATIICLVISVVAFVIAFVASRISFRNRGFLLSSDAFMLRIGVFRRRTTAIPYRQIQNVSVDQTLFNRMMGVSEVTIVTAAQDNPGTGFNEAEVVLPVVDRDIASDMQTRLLKLADVQKVVEADKA